MTKKKKGVKNKRGPLTKEDKAYLTKNKTKPVDQLAKRLKRSETSILAFLETLDPKPKDEAESQEKVDKPPKNEQLIEAARNAYSILRPGSGIVAFTQAAGEIGDEVSKLRSKKSQVPDIYIMRKNGKPND